LQDIDDIFIAMVLNLQILMTFCENKSSSKICKGVAQIDMLKQIKMLSKRASEKVINGFCFLYNLGAYVLKYCF